MVGVLMLNFPEDYCTAIDDDDLDQVEILLSGDQKALEKGLKRARPKKFHVLLDYDKAKED